MVKNTGAPTRPGPIRPLNRLRPVQVAEGADGLPLEVSLRPRLKVEAIEDRWRIDDEWWREVPISRTYFDCVLEDGRHITLVKDLITSSWYRQRD